MSSFLKQIVWQLGASLHIPLRLYPGNYIFLRHIKLIWVLSTIYSGTMLLLGLQNWFSMSPTANKYEISESLGVSNECQIPPP